MHKCYKKKDLQTEYDKFWLFFLLLSEKKCNFAGCIAKMKKSLGIYSEGLYRVCAYLSHLLRSRHTLGYGIHSPYLFYIARAILPETCRYYSFDKIEQLKTRMLHMRQKVYVEDFGTGSSGERRVDRIAHGSLKPSRQAQLLMRLAVMQKAEHMVELGTCLGISTAYMASANSNAEVISFEGAPELAELARRNWRELGLNNIRCVVGNIDETLPVFIHERTCSDEHYRLDMAFLDANHTAEATIRYFGWLKTLAGEKSIFVLDDIHASRDMHNAWKEICAMEGVTATMDLYDMGLVFFDSCLEKKMYRIRL